MIHSVVVCNVIVHCVRFCKILTHDVFFEKVTFLKLKRSDPTQSNTWDFFLE